MSSFTEPGKRLLVSLIDYIADTDPQRAWASIAKDDTDFTKGFVDITYTDFSNAINHAAWWLDAKLGRPNDPFEVFAYAGPKDLRYPVLAVAAVKTGRQASPPFLRLSE